MRDAPTPLLVETIADLRAACERARAAGQRVGLVPTMGFLHAGHRSLIRAARAVTDFVVVTIFVNPLQFAPHEDLDRYPRDLDGDVRHAGAEGADVVFAPSTTEMYPRPARTTVRVGVLTDDLCGAARPTHFDGVTTVVTKLFAIIGPCDAFFGRKDAQQLAVVTRMAEDLNLPVNVVGCPLLREPDGLALSSRNAYLSPTERAAAPVLFAALSEAAVAISDGERDPDKVRMIVECKVREEALAALEYVEVRDAHDLTPLTMLAGDVLVAVAARVGPTRLIDNIRCAIRGADVDVDRGEFVE
ncbi:MAG: pantoate--beta-alanine ligase [Actinomycetota bacterium]